MNLWTAFVTESVSQQLEVGGNKQVACQSAAVGASGASGLSMVRFCLGDCVGSGWV